MPFHAPLLKGRSVVHYFVSLLVTIVQSTVTKVDFLYDFFDYAPEPWRQLRQLCRAKATCGLLRFLFLPPMLGLFPLLSAIGFGSLFGGLFKSLRYNVGQISDGTNRLARVGHWAAADELDSYVQFVRGVAVKQ